MYIDKFGDVIKDKQIQQKSDTGQYGQPTLLNNLHSETIDKKSRMTNTPLRPGGKYAMTNRTPRFKKNQAGGVTYRNTLHKA